MLLHQYRYDERHRRLQPHDAERGVGDFLHLLVAQVRRVVRGDHVDHTAPQSLDHGEPVVLGAQRRIHLRHGQVFRDGGVGEREEVRRGLTGYVDPLLLRPPDDIGRSPRRDVRHVEPSLRQACEDHVPRDHHFFRLARDALQAQEHRVDALVHHAFLGEGYVLGVGDDRRVEHPGVLERAAHHERVHHRPAVV